MVWYTLWSSCKGLQRVVWYVLWPWVSFSNCEGCVNIKSYGVISLNKGMKINLKIVLYLSYCKECTIDHAWHPKDFFLTYWWTIHLKGIPMHLSRWILFILITFMSEVNGELKPISYEVCSEFKTTCMVFVHIMVRLKPFQSINFG